jgi:hypothetical protein
MTGHEPVMRTAESASDDNFLVQAAKESLLFDVRQLYR